MRPDPSPEEQPEERPPSPAVVVPDDASALARDVEALRRERRAAARRARLRRLVVGRSGIGVGAPVVLAVLLLVGLYGALPVLLRPELDGGAAPRPLAAPSAAPGTVGGLLPRVPLQAPEGPLDARDVARPGVVLLVPPRCGCEEDVSEAVSQAREFTRSIRLVTDGRQEGGVADAAEQAARLRREAARNLARTAVDPTGALTSAYAAEGLTVLPVAADGVVLDVLRGVRAGQRLEARLSVLQRQPA